MSNTQTPRRAKTAKADAPAEAVSSAPEPKLLTGQAFGKLLEAGPTTMDFQLTVTAPGFYAEVMPLDFTDPDMLTTLPEHLLRFALNLATDIEGGTNPAVDKDGTINAEKAVEMLKGEQALAKEMCVRGFVNPRLVHTEDEEDMNAGAIWVERIHASDRRRYMFAVLNPIYQEASSLSTFPERPAQSVGTR